VTEELEGGRGALVKAAMASLGRIA
jgi:hypothetical protein